LSPQGNTSASLRGRPYGRPDSSDAARLVGRLTAVFSIAAGVIHISAAADHENLPVMLAGFLVVATLQVSLGGLLLWRRPSGLLVVAALGLMLGSVGVWLVSRTMGLPFLPGGHMEPIGFKDGVTVLFELASVPGLLLLLSPELGRVSLPSPRLGTQALGFAGVASFMLFVPALVLGGGEHHSHDQMEAMGGHSHGGGDGHGHGGEELARAGGADGHGHGAGGDSGDRSGGGHEHGEAGAGLSQSGGSGGGGHDHGGSGGGNGGHGAGGGHDDGHGDGSGGGDGEEPMSLTYEESEPAKNGRPGKGPRLVFRSENGPYEKGAHSHELHGGSSNGCHPTPEQQAAADKLYADTTAVLKRYENNPALALADGFTQVVGPADRFVHMINTERVFSSTILEAPQIESFMYAQTDRGLVPLGGMYILPAEFKDGKVVPKEPKHGPQIGGCLTRWHKHEGWVAGVSTGGTNWEETPEMLHVWTYPGLDPWSHYSGPELATLWAPWKDVPSFCRISPGGTNVCFP
jgi:hypothetical protein